MKPNTVEHTHLIIPYSCNRNVTLNMDYRTKRVGENITRKIHQWI